MRSSTRKKNNLQESRGTKSRRRLPAEGCSCRMACRFRSRWQLAAAQPSQDQVASKQQAPSQAISNLSCDAQACLSPCNSRLATQVQDSPETPSSRSSVAVVVSRQSRRFSSSAQPSQAKPSQGRDRCQDPGNSGGGERPVFL